MSNDAQLQQAVLAELKWEPSVTAAHIGVTAKAGVVTLTGHVENYAQKYSAESAARRVKGVKAVAEEMEVRLPSDYRRGDEEIATAAIDRLAWDVMVPRDAIKIKVEKGWVTLTGQVDWHFESQAAADNIRGLMGVVGVSNMMTVQPRASAANISNDITHALHRSWFDPKTITVTANGGNVHLTGTVHSWYDRQLAGSTAWAAPGATSVENDIAIM